jgi:hypothetical protein
MDEEGVLLAATLMIDVHVHSGSMSNPPPSSSHSAVLFLLLLPCLSACPSPFCSAAVALYS